MGALLTVLFIAMILKDTVQLLKAPTLYALMRLVFWVSLLMFHYKPWQPLIFLGGASLLASVALKTKKHGSKERIETHPIPKVEAAPSTDNAHAQDQPRQEEIIQLAEQLFEAVEKGMLHVVKGIIPDKLPVGIYTDDRVTPLHMSALRGHLEMVRYLLNQGADVNAIDFNGWSPLHCASMNEATNYREFRVKPHQLEIVTLLLEEGSDPNMLDKENRTAMDLAIMSSPPEIDAVIEKHGGEAKMFMGAKRMTLEDFFASNNN